MAKLNEVIDKIHFYERQYRNQELAKFLISDLYDLFPANSEVYGWPKCYPFVDRAGIYLLMDDEENVLYVGKSSVAIGSRLGSYFCYDADRKSCHIQSPYWTVRPRYIVAVAVPVDSAFECASLEEYLLNNIQTSDNSIFQ